MDVLWFRVPRRPNDLDQSMGRFEAGRIFVLIDRGDYWQCAYVIPKGGVEAVRAAGLETFRANLYRRGCSASACGPSTCGRRSVLEERANSTDLYLKSC